jgi:hypothetical protein
MEIIHLSELPQTTTINTIQDLKDAKHRQDYQQQKWNAARRKIQFNLTYSEWLEIWTASGKLDQRGKQAGGYVMSRFGDKGNYEIGNVHITTTEENTREGNLGKKKSTRHAAKLRKHLNKVRKHSAVNADGRHFVSLAEAGRHFGLTASGIRKRCLSAFPMWRNWHGEGIKKRLTASQIRMNDAELKHMAQTAMRDDKEMREQRDMNTFLLYKAREARSSIFKSNDNDTK